MMNCRVSLGCCVALLLVGCGKGGQPVAEIEPVVPVKGVVLFEGKPLPDYAVIFNHMDGKRSAMGKTDAEGRFTLGTNGANDGAPAGMHDIAIVFQPPEPDINAGPIDDPKKLPKPKIQIPSRYSDPKTSGLKLTIPEDGNTDLKLELKK